MSAESIEWHEGCLKNSIRSHKRYVDNLKTAMDAELTIRLENERYAAQIERAKKLGKTKFDSERFFGGRKIQLPDRQGPQ